MFDFIFSSFAMCLRVEKREKLDEENLSMEKALNDWLSYWKMANSKTELRKSIK